MDVREKLRQGLVIPAHPLALNKHRRLNERRQRALTRYYLMAGAGGIAVGVHTTQFAIRNPKFCLLEPTLQLAMEEMRPYDVVKIAGVCGELRQATTEAELAKDLGYDAVLLSLGALHDAPVSKLLSHIQAIASIIPVIGFYLQPAVGGRILGYVFWRKIVEVPNVVAVKIAPFNRYQTLDVVRAVVESGRAAEIALYTGNDDNIVIDLLTAFEFAGKRARIVGGLLGHWAVWTRTAVLLLSEIKQHQDAVPGALLTRAQQVTDANAAIFDPSHQFHGCIPGIHEVLRRDCLLEGRWCLDPDEELSPGQSDEIDRVYRAYPEMRLEDEKLISEHLDEWLR
jgi:hypothetical protein